MPKTFYQLTKDQRRAVAQMIVDARRDGIRTGYSEAATKADEILGKALQGQALAAAANPAAGGVQAAMVKAAADLALELRWIAADRAPVSRGRSQGFEGSDSSTESG